MVGWNDRLKVEGFWKTGGDFGKSIFAPRLMLTPMRKAWAAFGDMVDSYPKSYYKQQRRPVMGSAAAKRLWNVSFLYKSVVR